jgi:lambda family phage portal protein
MLDRVKRAWDALTSSPKQAPQKRLGEYSGAMVDRLQNFVVGLRSEDQEIKSNLTRLRAHSRDLTRNNVFMRRFVKLVGHQVVGAKGVTMQANVRMSGGKTKAQLNDAIETAWQEWGRLGVCSVDGRMSWTDIQMHSVRGAARDGEMFWHKIRGRAAGNRFGFALQPLDPDLLDVGLQIPGGDNVNAVVMGVELNAWNRPVAFHFWTAHPSDPATDRRRIRIPAQDIIHFFDQNRASQTRGIPWGTSSMWILSMLGAYWEGEVAAARAESERLGFIINEMGDAEGPIQTPVPGGASDPSPVNVPSQTASWWELPAGYKAELPDVRHPNTAFAGFSAAMLHGIASGMNCSYHGLTGDLSSANYSSLRQGALDERDGWQELQRLLIDHLCQPIFSEWLDMAILAGAVDVPARDVEAARYPTWEPRGWEWVDPLKDTKADIMAVEAGLETRTAVLAGRGRNFEDVIRQLAEEKALAEQYGVDLSAVKNPDVATQDVTDGQKTSSSAA